MSTPHDSPPLCDTYKFVISFIIFQQLVPNLPLNDVATLGMLLFIIQYYECVSRLKFALLIPFLYDVWVLNHLEFSSVIAICFPSQLFLLYTYLHSLPFTSCRFHFQPYTSPYLTGYVVQFFSLFPQLNSAMSTKSKELCRQLN